MQLPRKLVTVATLYLTRYGLRPEDNLPKLSKTGRSAKAYHLTKDVKPQDTIEAAFKLSR